MEAWAGLAVMETAAAEVGLVMAELAAGAMLEDAVAPEGTVAVVVAVAAAAAAEVVATAVGTEVVAEAVEVTAVAVVVKAQLVGMAGVLLGAVLTEQEAQVVREGDEAEEVGEAASSPSR